MAGREDKNKKNRRDSNQFNHSYTNSADQRSNRDKRTAGGSPSLYDEKNFEAAAERNRGDHPEDRSTTFRAGERNFNLLLENVPYLVHAAPFDFNGETRYRISINGNDDHIFTWNSDLKRLTAIDDDASTLPDDLEVAISGQLQSKS